jgi:hypothetical protein
MGTAIADHPAGASPDKLRHVESMSELPSGAGKISGINAVVLGESLADEEHDLVFPSPEFSASALVSSPKQVWADCIISSHGFAVSSGACFSALHFWRPCKNASP